MIEQEENKKLRQKQKDKMQPKMGKLDIDYQVLHDAFFKFQTRPNFSVMGDLYYEGKEFEAKVCPDALEAPQCLLGNRQLSWLNSERSAQGLDHECNGPLLT